MNRQLTHLGCRLLASQLVLKMAQPNPTAAQKPDMSWLESYTKPFGNAWQKAKGIRADPTKDIDEVKGDFTGAAQDLWKQRPGTLLGLGGMLAGAGLGSTSDSPGASLRWAAILGALGLGGGYAWSKRGAITDSFDKWLQERASKVSQPILQEFQEKMDAQRREIGNMPAVWLANWAAAKAQKVIR